MNSHALARKMLAEKSEKENSLLVVASVNPNIAAFRINTPIVIHSIFYFWICFERGVFNIHTELKKIWGIKCDFYAKFHKNKTMIMCGAYNVLLFCIVCAHEFQINAGHA